MMIIMIDNVWDDATDWCKWLERWGIMRINIILQMSVSDWLTDKRESWDDAIASKKGLVDSSL